MVISVSLRLRLSRNDSDRKLIPLGTLRYQYKSKGPQEHLSRVAKTEESKLQA